MLEGSDLPSFGNLSLGLQKLYTYVYEFRDFQNLMHMFYVGKIKHKLTYNILLVLLVTQIEDKICISNVTEDRGNVNNYNDYVKSTMFTGK